MRIIGISNSVKIVLGMDDPQYDMLDATKNFQTSLIP